MARSHHDGGPHALATLSLELLGSDVIIREAIREMHLRSGADPWGGSSSHVEGLDLVAFFRYVRVNGINPANPTTSVEVIAKRMRESAGK